MYKILDVQISKRKYPDVFRYLDNTAHLANNLYNAALFRQRQMITSAKKDESLWTTNEREIRDEITHAVSLMRKPRNIPKSGAMSRLFLEEAMHVMHNPDYCAAGISAQTAQHTIRTVCDGIKSFYASVKAYNADPSKFTGKPSFPGYKRKQGASSFVLTNQDCRIRQNSKGHYVAKLPLTKAVVPLGGKIPGILKEVHVSPCGREYKVSFVFDDEQAVPDIPNKSKRIAAIDIGVDNLMAITNNCGLPCLLYKGGYTKSVNHHYNKQIASIMSKQASDSKAYFIPTRRYYAVTNKRNNRLHDFMLKTGKHFITWCVENRIDTIVIGSTPFWKQEVDIGSANNQKFVQIPFDQLKNIVSYLAERNGIRVIKREESYTSKASFLDRDNIPTYKVDDGSAVFSGKRIKRGLYRASDGRCINADLNGSANILRKEFPSAFKKDPEFENIIVIKHPDIK